MGYSPWSCKDSYTTEHFQVSVRVRFRVRLRVRVGGGRRCAERWWPPGRGWVQVGSTG